MASFNFQSGFNYQGMHLLINTHESQVPDIITDPNLNVDWYANAYLVYDKSASTSWTIETKLGYAKLDSSGEVVLGVHWVLYGKQEFVTGGQALDRLYAYISTDGTHYTQYSEQELWDGMIDACATTEKAVGDYCVNNPDGLYGIKGIYDLTYSHILTRNEAYTAMENGYTHLCINSTGNPFSVSYTSTTLPYIDTLNLNRYGFGWITQATSFSETLKVKVKENNEHKWKGVTSAYVNVVEYDDDDEPIGHFWKPISSAKVVRNERWKSLQTGIGAIMF